MKDMIYRDDAIKAINKHNACGWVEESFDVLEKELQNVPSAIPIVGDLISRKKLMEYCENQKDKTISNNDIARFPSIESVQREWIKTIDGNGWNDWWVLKCPFCGATIEDKNYRSWEYNYCPHCGNRVKGDDNE